MGKQKIITEKNFEVLLNWLDRNRELAAQKYEIIRRRLIRIFAGRGCRSAAEELADQTFDRVTKKMPSLADSYTGDPALYFYGVADKIYLEWLRRQKKINLRSSPENSPAVNSHNDQAPLEIEYDCLESCLKKLPVEDSLLITEYYKNEKTDKIENRRKLAEKSGLTPGALQVKASRIRTRLRACGHDCLAEKNKE